MAYLHLLRHGALPPNPHRRFIGQSDVPLSDTGRAQAELWRTRMARIPFVRAWTSDLPRCRLTAERILAGRTVPLCVEPQLREIHLGAWQGLTKAQVEQRFPGALAARAADYAGYRPEGGESFTQLGARVLPTLRHILRHTADDAHVLVVAHCGVLGLALRHYMAVPQQHIFCLAPPYAGCVTLRAAAEDF